MRQKKMNAFGKDYFKKPKERPLPDLCQDMPSSGNRSILVLCNSAEPAEYKQLNATIISALRHMGVPYEILDLNEDILSDSAATGHALLLIAQEHLGRSLDERLCRSMVSAISLGIGLCSFDPWIQEYPVFLRDTLGLRGGMTLNVAEVMITDNSHFISVFRDKGETVAFRKPVPSQYLEHKGNCLLSALDAGALLRFGRIKKGKFVWWGCSSCLWLPEFLGHAWGLDDLFWRGLVWAAAKPFVIKAMPPYTTMRFDDCSGFGSVWWILGNLASKDFSMPKALRRILNLKFGARASVVDKFNYVKILNEFSWRPEISLFVDQIMEEDWLHLKRIYDNDGGVQVSAHSFADGFDADGNWYSHFTTHRGIEVDGGGNIEFRYHLDQGDIAPEEVEKYSGKKPSYRIARYSDETLRKNFCRLDRLWRKKGIKPGLSQNLHWRNPPSNALKFLKEREQNLLMCSERFNYAATDPENENWRMLPYGQKGMCFDYLPIPLDAEEIEPTDFFNAVAQVFSFDKNDPYGDNSDFFRCEKEVIPGLLTHRNLDLVVKAIVRAVKLGLQSLFFACPRTHEMNLVTLDIEDWRNVLQAVEKKLSRYPREFVLYDDAAKAARSKCETHVEKSNWDGKKLVVNLTGRTRNELNLRIFKEINGFCVESSYKVSRFDRHKTITI